MKMKPTKTMKTILLFSSIRMKLIALCLFLLLVPCLIIGIVGYQQSKSSLDDGGRVQLKNNVRFTMAMIESLDQQVKQGNISLEEAQESVKQQILGKKKADGNRPISKRFDMGEYGYLFVYDEKGNSLASPLSEGKNDWELKSPQGVMVIQELIKNAQNGGGYLSYIWKLPTDPTKTAPKITYSEKDPNWGWVICEGTFMSDFNKGANGIFTTVVITLIASLVIGGLIIFLFSGRITKPLQVIAKHVERIALGDLREKISIRTKDEVGQLAVSVNDMVDRFRQLIGGIFQTSHSVASAAEQISASTEQIASGSTHQAVASQTITDLFKELSEAMSDVANSAKEAAALSSQTAKTALEGGKAVTSSIEGMNQVSEQMARMEQDSNKIGEIIEVIDDIAEQTNLLALNAAIEAARAGEQGRGFAVVADEVRKLAERSGEATKQITSIIKGMQHNTKESVASVAGGVEKSIQTGKAFETIVNMVNDSAQKVTEIASASEQQSVQTGEVMKSVESIAATSEEAAAAAEETAATSQSLAHLADELNTSVSVFKI
jgi:methyl-accepting chemotaxis protein